MSSFSTALSSQAFSNTPTPTPKQLLQTLFPFLKVAAAYAQHIQPHIAARPAKEGYTSIFGSALSDADLSIQTMIEVSLLGNFPSIRFYGEEHEQSYNTRYFRAITLGPQDDYLITLDPIDGTRYYLDGHDNYQILLGILNRDEFAGAIALTPSQNLFCYGLHGQGLWQGHLNEAFEDARPLQLSPPKPTILLGLRMGYLRPALEAHYTVLDVDSSYAAEVKIPNVNGILTGDLAGVIIRSSQFIDGALLGFLAQEGGCQVSTHTGATLPPLHECDRYSRPGLVMARSPEVHHHLLQALQTTPAPAA